MLSKIPFSLEKISEEDIDREVLRSAIIAELDAVNLYEQMAALVTSDHIRAVLLDVAKEEKTHIGEFQALLLSADLEQANELKEGLKEVEELKKAEETKTVAVSEERRRELRQKSPKYRGPGMTA